MIIESDSIAATDSTQVEEDDVNLCSVIVAHNSEVDGDGNVNVELELKYDRKNERVKFFDSASCNSTCGNTSFFCHCWQQNLMVAF